MTRPKCECRVRNRKESFVIPAVPPSEDYMGVPEGKGAKYIPYVEKCSHCLNVEKIAGELLVLVEADYSSALFRLGKVAMGRSPIYQDIMGLITRAKEAGIGGDDG